MFGYYVFQKSNSCHCWRDYIILYCDTGYIIMEIRWVHHKHNLYCLENYSMEIYGGGGGRLKLKKQGWHSYLINFNPNPYPCLHASWYCCPYFLVLVSMHFWRLFTFISRKWGLEYRRFGTVEPENLTSQTTPSTAFSSLFLHCHFTKKLRATRP